jgi:hypothetical protein
MIPPRFVPPGILQLYEVVDGVRVLVQELPTSSRNRDRINQMRNELLMLYPTNIYVLSENNAIRPAKDDRRT